MFDFRRGFNFLKRNGLTAGLILTVLLLSGSYLKYSSEVHELNGQVGQLQADLTQTKKAAARAAKQVTIVPQGAPKTDAGDTAQPAAASSPVPNTVYKTTPAAPAAPRVPAPPPAATPAPSSQPAASTTSQTTQTSTNNPPKQAPQPLICIAGLICI